MSPLILTAEVDGKKLQKEKAQPVNKFHFKYTKNESKVDFSTNKRMGGRCRE